jgi:preprotein translocase subunit SecA
VYAESGSVCALVQGDGDSAAMIEKITGYAKKLFGDANDRELKKLRPIVQRVNELESVYEALADHEVQAKTVEFKTKLDNGAPLDDLMPDAFATVREAAKRTLGMRHYDCQIIGGSVLHSGRIAEMKTGEGKTLVATLPVYLNAVGGKGAHVVTVNDYLASRDADWMAAVYNFLGLSVGKIMSGERNDQIKRAAYAADITYGTNNEFGFDYLRDNMKFRIEDYVQRGHNYGIVDEVDSILIDEARTPLIISGPADASIDLYYIIDAVIPLLVRDLDFTVDEKAKNVSLTDEGVTKIEQRLGIDNLFDLQNMEVLHHVNQSLKAHQVFKRDKDYVVRDGKVVIVDEFTGRLMHGRRWSDGLHQAVEAKEKVKVEAESQVYATITFQNLFRMYDKLAGMTGTAETEAAEFAAIYDLDTVVIPTNRPVARLDHNDIVYKTEMEKFRAVVEDIRVCQGKGQPVLVGTTSVEKSEILSRLLKRYEVPHEVLNAKNHAREAHIVSQAGRLGAVTISTNMAGRGTDIKLGGNPEEMARAEVDPEVDPEGNAALIEKYIAQTAEEQKRVLAAGGLHIIGTERHDSRRVDNQLRGRAGRQGDPGSSRFFLSLEDQLLRLFGTDKLSVWMERMGLQDDEPIEHRWVTRSIENAQKKVEGHHFQMRKQLLEYDDVMNYQRKAVYGVRRRALSGDDIDTMMYESLDHVVEDIMEECCVEGLHPEHWNIDGLKERLERIFGVKWEDSPEELRDHSRVELRDRMAVEAKALLEARIAQMGSEVFDQIARMLVLQFTDQLWKDHLLAIDRLRQGVGLRGYGQRNPLLEYKREAYHMFLHMEAVRDESVLQRIFFADADAAEAAAANASKSTARRIAANPVALKGGVAPQAASKVLAGVGKGVPKASSVDPAAIAAAAAAPAQPAPARRPQPGEEARAFALEHGISRNDPCPCGSGKKFKKCCGAGMGKSGAAPSPA